MKKKYFILLVVIFSISSLFAQSGLLLDFTDHSKQEVFLNEIQKISFIENKMLLSATNTYEYPLNSIRKITFVTISAIPHNRLIHDISLFPNPAESIVVLKGNFPPQSDCSIYTLEGKMVLQTKTSNNEAVSVANLQTGLYILKIENTKLKFNKL